MDSSQITETSSTLLPVSHAAAVTDNESYLASGERMNRSLSLSERESRAKQPFGVRISAPVSRWFSHNKIVRPFLGELFGTFLLVWFGIGSVSSAVITGALKGLWQVATVWGFGIAVAIFTTAPISGAHLNPAVSIAMAIFNPDFSWFKCMFYIVAQFLGAILAGLVNYGVYGSAIARFERANGIVRGLPGSERSAMTFGEYFPNPDVFQLSGNETMDDLNAIVSPAGAMCVEALGTAIIVLVIFALTDKCNMTIMRGMEPFFIGFCVAVNISLLAPLSQAGFNPARDFGPRLVAYFGGWGEIAIPGPRNGFWVYLVGPVVGAVLGGGMYEMFLRKTEIECEKSKCE